MKIASAVLNITTVTGTVIMIATATEIEAAAEIGIVTGTEIVTETETGESLSIRDRTFTPGSIRSMAHTVETAALATGHTKSRKVSGTD